MTATTITLIHGFMGDPSDWDLLRSDLTEYDLVAPHIRPADDWESGVHQLIDELPRRSVLVGYSMGARLSLAVALQRPEICAGLILVSGNPGIEDDRARQTRRERDLRLSERIETEPRGDFLHFWYHESTVFKSLTDDLRNDEIQRKLAHPDDDWADLLRSYTVGNQPNMWPKLGDLRIPVLAVAGQFDRKYSNIVLRMNRFENIQARIVPACGHIVHREQPYVFLWLVREYLKTWSTQLTLKP